MEKKTKMADVPSWNIRTKNQDFTINTVIFKSENITQEISDELKKRLSTMSRYVAKNLLWSEMNTMSSVIYKHHNQHRKEKYFQGLERIQKHLVRLREMKLEILLSSFVENMPKKTSKSTTVTSYPCEQTIEHVLFNFMGAAKLISQGIRCCKSTTNFVGGHLSKGFFVTFHIVIAASLSRIWILLKDFLDNILECYQKLYPWLGLLQETAQQGDRNLQSELIPTCLKSWIVSTEPDNTVFETENRESEPVTPQTSVVLEKLFSFTPASEQSTGITFTESLDASLNSTHSLLEASEPVPRELYKKVSFNTPQSLETCGMKHKLKPEFEFHSHKRLHFDEEPNHETSRMVETNNGNGRKERPYKVIHYPNKMARYSTPHGTFKIPHAQMKRITCNSKMFESKVKKQEMLQDKWVVQQLHKPRARYPSGYRKKRILINAKCSKSNYKIFFKKNKKEYQRRWRRKISSVIRLRQLGELRNQNLTSWSNATCNIKINSTLAPNLDSTSYLNVNRAHHGKDSEEQSFSSEHPSSAPRKYPSDISILENVGTGENSSMPRKEQCDQTFKRIVQESKCCHFERQSTMIAKSNGKMLHHQTKDDVDDIFELLGV